MLLYTSQDTKREVKVKEKHELKSVACEMKMLHVVELII